MRVLLDEQLPLDLAAALQGHSVDTVVGRGWAGITNGELLRRMHGEYDALIKHPLVLKTLNWGGAAFLLRLSWRIATSSSRIESMPERNPVGYLGAAVFQWVNPKSWLVSASAASTFLSADAGSPILQAASLGGLFFLAALPSCFLWPAFGAAVQHVVRSRRRLRIFNVVTGALLALSIALIVR